MTSPGGNTLSWNLHGNDTLSAVLEKLDRTLSGISRRLDGVSGEAKDMGRALGEAGRQADRMGGRVVTTTTHVSRFTDRITGAVLRLKDLALTAGVTVAAGLAAAATAVVSLGVKTAAANETAQISFEVLLGSAEKAKDFLGQLQKFAAATPFELPQLREAASRLLAVGVNTRDIIPLLTRLGDATAAMGTGAFGIERAVYALQQMRQAGKVSLEDINQLTDAGIPALDALSAKLGITVAQLREKISAGQIKPEQLFDAILTGTGKTFPRLKGMMDKQSATLSGIWSTFKDNVSQTLGSFLEPALPGIKRFVLWSSDAIPAGLAKLRSMGHDIGDIFAGSGLKQEFIESLRNLGEHVLPSLKDNWHRLVDTVRENKDGLEKFGRFITDIVIPALSTILPPAIDIAANSIGGLVLVIANVTGAFQLLAHMAVASLRAIVEGAAAALGPIGMRLIPGLEEARKKFNSWADDMDAKLNALDGKTVDITFNLRAKSAAKGPHDIDYVGRADPDDPRFGGRRAGGGPTYAGDWYRVGEKGPEDLYMPGDGFVYPNQSGGGGVRRQVIGLLRVVHERPDGTVIREELLELKRNRGLGSLGF